MDLQNANCGEYDRQENLIGKIVDLQLVSKPLHILHFNDVYEIDAPANALDPVGGAPRFATLLKRLREGRNSLLLFSGDALNPSIFSNFTHGKHMIDALNLLRVDCAVAGNHDFDFGVDNLEDCVADSNFPWLLSNVLDNYTGGPLADAPTTHILNCDGHKIGLMGLVEEEWLCTLPTINDEDLTVLDFVEEGRVLAQDLRREGCDFIIALTHMRMPNNRRLAESVDEIDLFLCGHDHFYCVEQVKGKYVVVSGCDFKFVSEITVTFDGPASYKIDVKEHRITKEIPEDPEMRQLVNFYARSGGVLHFKGEIDEKLDTVIARFDVDLDGRFTTVRAKESNLGNLITYICDSATDSDCCLINGGTFRSDRVHPAGAFTLRDLQTILPFMDAIVVIEIDGRDLLAALDHGVSSYPALDGRFPQVSGIRFAFDKSKPPKQRIDPRLVIVNDEFLDLNKTYKLCTKDYLASGKDGYTMLANKRFIVSSEDYIMVTTLVQNYFISLQMVKGLKQQRSLHHQHLVSRRTPIVRRMSEQIPNDRSNRNRSMVRQTSIQEVESTEAVSTAPNVERRIVEISKPEDFDAVLKEFRDFVAARRAMVSV